MSNSYRLKYYGISIILSAFNLLVENPLLSILCFQIAILIDIFQNRLVDFYSKLTFGIIFICIILSLYKVLK